MVMGEKFRRTSSSRIRSINGVIELSFLCDPKITLRERIVVRRGMRSGDCEGMDSQRSVRLEVGFFSAALLRRAACGAAWPNHRYKRRGGARTARRVHAQRMKTPKPQT